MTHPNRICGAVPRVALLLGLAALLILAASCSSRDQTQAGDVEPDASFAGAPGGYTAHRFIVKPGGVHEQNIYLVVDPRSKQGLILDPGARSADLEAYVRAEGFRIMGVLNTHAHYDHIGANGFYRQLYKVDVYADAGDSALYAKLGQGVDPEDAPTRELPSQGDLKLGALQVRVIPTPGHSAGSVCFVMSDMLFSGDTLFRGGVGRTVDSATEDAMIKNIKDRLLVLPADMPVYPGHGEATTVGLEAEQNAFLQGP